MKPEPKISLTEAYLLIVFAIIADLLSIVPLLNDIVAVIFTFGSQIYYFMKGVNGIAGIAAEIIEFIPVLSILPGTLLGVVLVILIDRAAATKLGQTALKTAGPAGKLAISGGKPSVTSFKNPAKITLNKPV